MDFLEFKQVGCNLCGSGQQKLVLKSTDQNYHVPGQFTIVQCKNCGLVYQNPRPTSETLVAAYPDNYGPHSSVLEMLEQPKSSFEAWKEDIMRQLSDFYYFSSPSAPQPLWKRFLLFPFYFYARLMKVNILPNARCSSRLLDIGCGTGKFLSEMLVKGWDVYGVEPDEKAASIAESRSGIHVHTGPFTSGLFSRNYFDLITMWHVLEHLEDPFGSLEEVFRLLRPGGCFIVMLPNINSLEYAVFRESWFHLDLPRHLYHFSDETIQQMLEQVGFQVTRIMFQIEPASLRGSIRNAFGISRSDDGIVQRLTGRISWVLSFLLAQMNSSGTIIVYATKEE